MIVYSRCRCSDLLLFHLTPYVAVMTVVAAIHVVAGDQLSIVAVQVVAVSIYRWRSTEPSVVAFIFWGFFSTKKMC